MILGNLFDQLLGRGLLSLTSGGAGRRSPEGLRSALERERARSNRTGQVFSFLTFTVRNGARSQDVLDPVMEILSRRLRVTDEFGWLDETHIGAILPDTPVARARKVAEDVLAECAGNGHRPVFELFWYPQNGSKETAGTRGSQDPHEAVEADGPAEGRPADTAAARIETLLAQRLPLWKRVLDVTGAAAGLLVTAPLLAFAALAVRLSSPGPVIFTQQRMGHAGKRFTIYKFRTMTVDAESRKAELRRFSEQDGPAFKMKNDPRITTVGRILRKTSVDELPQLWNVLKGDMSLVGPRPLPCDESEACDLWQQQRLDVTPGLTGLWQVKGRSQTGFADWVRMDMRYIRARSFLQDLKLLILTVPAVILRKGAH